MYNLRYTCILFDLDGTVLDTVSDCAAALNKTLLSFSLPQHTNDEVRSYLNDGARMLVKRAMPENARGDEALVDRILSEYIENYRICCTQSSRIYDGVHETLQKLRDMGAVMGIVTNKPDVQTQIMVPHYFGDIFSYCCGNSEKFPVKPDAKRVFMALDSLGKTAEETFFVGDSHVDVQTARNAGIPAVGVAWGFGGREAFRNNTPDIIIEAASELINIAQQGF